MFTYFFFLKKGASSVLMIHADIIFLLTTEAFGTKLHPK